MIRFARGATPPAVEGDSVRESGPDLARQESSDFFFDAIRIITGGEPETLNDSPEVRVHHKCRPGEAHPEDDVRGLPADAWQGEQILHPRGKSIREALCQGL